MLPDDTSFSYICLNILVCWIGTISDNVSTILPAFLQINNIISQFSLGFIIHGISGSTARYMGNASFYISKQRRVCKTHRTATYSKI